MKYILVAFALFITFVAEAYNPAYVAPEKPYEEIVISMDEQARQQSYLGMLDKFPHLFEFSLNETITLKIKTKQLVTEKPEPVNLILLTVKEGNGGVEEIVRMNTPVKDRIKVRNPQLAMTTLDSEWLEVELEPGLYRLEVSTPVNLGPYELDFGEETVSGGYFGTFKAIHKAQQHFGYSWTRIMMSTYVLYQVGILLLVGGIYYTWRRQKQVKEVSETPYVS